MSQFIHVFIISDSIVILVKGNKIILRQNRYIITVHVSASTTMYYASIVTLDYKRHSSKLAGKGR